MEYVSWEHIQIFWQYKEPIYVYITLSIPKIQGILGTLQQIIGLLNK
jgi:hypothetical protein